MTAEPTRVVICDSPNKPINSRMQLLAFHVVLQRVMCLRAMFVICVTLISGCAPQKMPTEATLSWLAPETRAAKPPDCVMPLLSALPNTDYQELAIVEVTADYDSEDQEVRKVAQRKACESGADALVIVEDQRQDSSLQPMQVGQHDWEPHGVGDPGHRGRVLSGVAIAYDEGHSNSGSK